MMHQSSKTLGIHLHIHCGMIVGIPDQLGADLVSIPAELELKKTTKSVLGWVTCQ